MEAIGNEYKVLELKEWGAKVTVGTRLLRDLQPGEALVQVMCAGIIHADLSFVTGSYGRQKPTVFPIIPGMQGSGLVVKVGEGMDAALVGKRVGLISGIIKGQFEGTWSQYAYTTIRGMLVFDDSIEYEKICYAFVDPLTVCGFVQLVKKNNLDSLAQNGSNGAVGKMLIKLAKKENIKTVNLVRKSEHIEQLTTVEADNVVTTSKSNREKDFQETANKLNTRAFFECVGGEMTGKVLSLLPDGATVYHYGNLELKKIGDVNSADLIFKEKTLTGFWLSNWTKSLKPEELYY